MRKISHPETSQQQGESTPVDHVNGVDHDNACAKPGTLNAVDKHISGDQLRKRKLTDQSEMSITPEREDCNEECDEESADTTGFNLSANANLYPLFCKKDVKDASQTKDYKEQREGKKKRKSKKKAKTVEYECEEDLKVLDVKLVMSMFNQLKGDIKLLKADQSSTTPDADRRAISQQLQEIPDKKEIEEMVNSTVSSAIGDHAKQLEEIQNELKQQRLKTHMLGELLCQKQPSHS